MSRPDARNASGASVFGDAAPRRCFGGPPAICSAAPARHRNAAADEGRKSRRAADRGAADASDPRRRRAPKRVRKLPVDRSKYETIRTLDRLKDWVARIHDAGMLRDRGQAPNSIDPMQADMCGIALALAPNDACYIPLAPQAVRRRRRPVRRRPRAGPDRGARRARSAEADAGIRGHSEDRLQRQVHRRDAGAARHRHAATPTTRS